MLPNWVLCSSYEIEINIIYFKENLIYRKTSEKKSEKSGKSALRSCYIRTRYNYVINIPQRLINLEIPVLVRSLKSSNVELG